MPVPGKNKAPKGTKNELASQVHASGKVQTTRGTYMLLTPRYQSSTSDGQVLHARGDIHDVVLDAVAQVARIDGAIVRMAEFLPSSDSHDRERRLHFLVQRK